MSSSSSNPPSDGNKDSRRRRRMSSYGEHKPTSPVREKPSAKEAFLALLSPKKKKSPQKKSPVHDKSVSPSSSTSGSGKLDASRDSTDLSRSSSTGNPPSDDNKDGRRRRRMSSYGEHKPTSPIREKPSPKDAIISLFSPKKKKSPLHHKSVSPSSSAGGLGKLEASGCDSTDLSMSSSSGNPPSDGNTDSPRRSPNRKRSPSKKSPVHHKSVSPSSSTSALGKLDASRCDSTDLSSGNPPSDGNADGCRRRRLSSCEEHKPTSPVREKPSAKGVIKALLSPKKKKLPQKKSPQLDKSVSPRSSTRPILSSQCSGKSIDTSISPIMNLGTIPGIYSEASRASPSWGDSRFDFGSLDEEKIIPSFFSSRTCYDAMPKSGKVIVLSTELLVKNAFSCLVTNEIRAAPLWESSSQTFIGMLTISDFINVLRHYYYSSQDDIKDIENQKIVTWRKITSITRPIIKIPPNDSLVNATKLLIEERIHRLPVFDERRNSVLFVISRKRLLQYLYNNLMEKFGKTLLKVPSYWRKTLGELRSQIGTWENIATVSVNTKVIEALDLFCERQVSALPVMNEDNKLVDIFAKFDVFALAKEQTYDNLDMTVAEALDKAEVHEDVYGCSLDEPLGTVIDRFVAAKVHRLVVVDEKQTVIGMLSLSDILKFLVLQPLEDASGASATIDEAPEGAVGGQEDSSVFLSPGQESTGKFQKSSSLEKQDSSDISEDLGKLQLGDTSEPHSESSSCKET